MESTTNYPDFFGKNNDMFGESPNCNEYNLSPVIFLTIALNKSSFVNNKSFSAVGRSK